MCEPDYCDDKGGGLPYLCKVPLLPTQVICADSDTHALYECQKQGGEGYYPNCDGYDYGATGTDSGQETGGETGGETGADGPEWDPGAYVHYDAQSGEYRVDKEFLGALKADWTLLHNDNARLVATASGYYMLDGVALGDLSDVMGLRSGDVLLDVNGYDLGTLDGQVTAYSELEGEVELVVTIQRGEEILRLSYVVVD